MNKEVYFSYSEILKLGGFWVVLSSCKTWYLPTQGIALSNGYLWKSQRRFANTHLKYFGEGKKTLETSIIQECSFLCQAMKEEQGKYSTESTNIKPQAFSLFEILSNLHLLNRSHKTELYKLHFNSI